MKECPYCGSEEYHIKQRFKGTCNYHMRFNGGDGAYNGEMWDNAQFKVTSKYAWCSNCGKRLFKLPEDMLI